MASDSTQDREQSLWQIVAPTPDTITPEQREVLKSLTREEVEMLLKLNDKLTAKSRELGAAGFGVEGRDDEEFVCCIC